MKVYLVENTGNCPGRIDAVFASEDDARRFAEYLGDAEVEERTLFYGQPPNPGYNE